MKHISPATGLLAALALCTLTPRPLFPQESPGGSAPEEDFEFPEEAVSSGEITVTASRETTQVMKTITREEIEAAPASSLAEIISETAGLGITSYGAAGGRSSLIMRGFDSERIAFLIDGVPVNSAETGEFDLAQIDPASVEAIEVIYGGSDSKYNVSGALGGVINIITIKKQKKGLTLGGSVSNLSSVPWQYRERSGALAVPRYEDLFDTQRYSLRTGWGADRYSLGGGLFATRAGNHYTYWDEDTGTYRRKEANEVWDAGANLSFVRALPYGLSTLIVSGRTYYGDKNVPTGGKSSIAGRERDLLFAPQVMLDAPRAFHDSLAAEGSLSYQVRRTEYTPPGGAAAVTGEHTVQAVNRWTVYPREGLLFRAGWDYRFIALDAAYHKTGSGGGMYLTAEWGSSERFLVIPSVKGVFNSSGRERAAVIPKLGLLWKPVEALTLKNNYFRSFKFPDFEDLYWGLGSNDPYERGNPDLKSEDGWGADLGAVFTWKVFRGEAAVFAQYALDSIHWSAAGGRWRPENIGEAFFLGAESTAKVEAPLPFKKVEKVTLSLGYRYFFSRLLSYGYSFASGKRIPYSPDHTVTVSAALTWKAGGRALPGRAALSGRCESLKYTNTANTSSLDPLFLLNLDAEQALGKQFTLFLALKNLLNVSYESYKDYPMPGLTITVGGRVLFEGIGEK